MVQIAMFTAVVAVLSQIAIPMPSGVPVTLQTLAVALCGYVLGSKKGAVSLLVYALLGAVGAPVFANFKGGAWHCGRSCVPCLRSGSVCHNQGQWLLVKRTAGFRALSCKGFCIGHHRSWRSCPYQKQNKGNCCGKSVRCSQKVYPKSCDYCEKSPLTNENNSGII